MKVVWIDDVAAMAIADSMGLTHVSETIEICKIDRGKSSENRAREIPLDESRIEGIRCSMIKGIPIPKIFVRATDAKRVIAGGNHRFNSLPDWVDCIPVHSVLCTDSEFEVFCRALNTVVGDGLSQTDRLRSAVDAVERLGMTRKDAASVFGLKDRAVEIAVRKAITERRALALVPNARNKMTQTHFVKIGKLADNDNVLQAAAIYVDKAKADCESLSNLVDIAKLKTTEAEQVAVFVDATQPFLKGKSVFIPKKTRQSFLKAITYIESLQGKKSWSSLEIDQTEVQSMKLKAENAARILNSLCKVDG